MLKKLFWEDPYLKECEATVKSVTGPEVTLDQTVFFAFSGGQASDSGTIGGVPVKEAVASGDDIIYILEQPASFREGEKVKVVINWDRRYKIMRLHSAAHIVYQLFVNKFGQQKLIGSNVSEEKSRVDFLFPQSLTEAMPELQKQLDDIMQKDLEIKTYPDPENPQKRWWEIEGFGRMPCGGTHVRRTGELGKIILKRKNIGAGKERIEITFG